MGGFRLSVELHWEGSAINGATPFTFELISGKGEMVSANWSVSGPRKDKNS